MSEINNEQVLIHKAQNGDVTAFSELIESYQQNVYNLAYRMSGNAEDAADIAQEAFIKLYLSISKFKGNAKFSTWVYRITTNACLDAIKKRKKTKTYSISDSVETEEGEYLREFEDLSVNVEEGFERKEQQRIINEAIATLPEKHRAIIILRDINELSYEEIAATLNCSEGTVKSRISRARANLYEVLKKNQIFFD